MHWTLMAADWTHNAFGLARAAFWFALILLLVAGGVVLVRRYQMHGHVLKSLHDKSVHDTDDPSELLTKFRELHSRGTLSDEEYRTIKTKLASEMQSRLPDTPSAGKS